MKKFLLLAALLACLTVQGQTRWLNPFDEGAETHGQGWSELRHGFSRLPDNARDKVREPVWDLSRNSAGLSLVFRSNSGCITVRYTVKGGLSMFHMPATGVSGVDMYATDDNGRLRWCAADFTPSFQDTVTYRYSGLTYFDNSSSYEYHLYLPMYNTVTWLQIGVDDEADIVFYPESQEKPLVVYGTSIAQGACASRPGMAWSNIVERETGLPLVNLGFSGNGKLEPELFELLSQIDAALYIIDCMPNMNESHPIEELVKSGVHKLREKHSCPILLVEHSGYVNEVSNASRSYYRNLNAELRKGYEALLSEGIEGLYYMTNEEIGLGMDGMVEGVHPNDLGMRRQADGVIAKVAAILGLDRASE